MDGEEYSFDLLSKITDGLDDQQSLDVCLAKSTIETVLKFESINGISPLVQCIRRGVSHLDTVRCMLNSGLYACETIDNTGQSALARLACECVNNDQHIKRIIAVLVKDVDQATACYKLLKLNSLLLFKVYLEGNDEDKMFQSITTAITNLKVRQIGLTGEVHLFVMWKLADYGYRKLTGDWTDGETSDSWKNHIEVITDCWRDIVTHKYDNNDDVDDRFLHRLRMIHNHLYFIKFKKFLEHLPIWEIVFCVAVFMNIYAESTNYHYYRLMINKRIVIEWLAALVPALERVKDELVKIEPVLSKIVTDMDDKYDSLLSELVDKLGASNIKNKDHLVRMYRADMASGKNSKNELVKKVMKVLKRVEKNYCDAKTVEIKALESGGVLVEIKTHLNRVVHPENVCNRLLAETKNKSSIDTIVANIIADEAFDFKDLSLRPGVMETIRQCYSQMKQFYSLAKIHKCISIVTKVDPHNNERFVACVKRTLTVIGEAINNTKNTPNMPDNRVDAAVQRMFMYQFKELNIRHRNTYTHEMSRNRLEVNEDTELKQLKQLPQHMRIIGVMLELLLLAIGANIRHSFYDMLYRCETPESQRALLVYVGENDILREVEDDWWEDVSSYYAQARELLTRVSQEPVGQTPQFAQVKRSFSLQLSIVRDVKQMMQIEREFSYESVRKTCVSCKNLPTVKNLLSLKLHSYNPGETLESICNSWDADIANLSDICWKNPQLLQLNPIAASTTLTMLHNTLILVNQYNYAEHTRKLIEDLGCIEMQSVDDKAWQELNEKLVPYYENVFLLDKKWNALKEFCVARNVMWNSALEDELRQRDRCALQDMFDDRRQRLRSLFEQCGIRTVDDLIDIDKYLYIPSDAIAAMEYVQVELCEMLLAVKYFGDNFEAIKHSLPMIQGKSYRNYLAHDALSYDHLTCSGDEKCVINAFIFAHTSVSLFGDRPKMPPLSFPSLEDTKRWIDQQQELRAAFVTGDARLIHEKMLAGGEIKGRFYGSPDIRYHPTMRFSITDLVEWSCQINPNVVALLKRYFILEENYDNPITRRLNNTLIPRDFEEAFNVSNHEELPEELLAWSSLPLETLTRRCQRKGWQTVLKELFDHGNEQCALQVIRGENIIATQTYSDVNLMNALLSHAMLRGVFQSASLLFSKMCCHLVPITVELAIIVHWNALLKHDEAKPVLDDERNMEDMIVAAINVSNYEAIGWFLNRDRSRSKLILDKCYLVAASSGNCAVLEKLCKYYLSRDDSILTVSLNRAAVKKHWDCVRLLLGKNAAADAVYIDRNGDESCALLLLVQFGMIDLVRCIKSINCSKFCCTSTEHPFSVASDAGTLSEEMIEVIESLGFGYLDNPRILHATVDEGYGHLLWSEAWEQIDDIISHPFAEYTDRLKLLMKVLCRWRWIGFIEKPYGGSTTLSCAVAADDELNVLGELINRAGLMRTLQDDGLVLGDIAIWNGSAMVRFSSEQECEELCIRRACDEIMHRVGTLQGHQTELHWKEFPIDIGELPIKFSAFETTNVHHDTGGNLQMRDTTSIADNLHDLLTISNALFSEHSTVYASLSKGTRTLHFLQIEDWCCAFDVFPPEGIIDLSNMMNARLKRGKTVLYNAIKYDCELASIKLLVDNGANPLLADNNGNTAVAAAIEHTNDPSFALYLMEACIANDLRNADGCSLEEMMDWSGQNSLSDLAEECGHQKAVQFLHRLRR